MSDGRETSAERPRLLPGIWAQIQVIAPAIALLIAGFAIAYLFVEPAPPSRIVMATGSEAGAYHAYAERYAERFAKEGIELALRPSAGSTENLALLTKAEGGVPVAFLQGGIGTPEAHPELTSLGSVYYEPIWVFVRSETEPRRLTELAGKRIAVGRPGSGTRTVALALLAENGIGDGGAKFAALGGAEAAEALRNGNVDAAIFVTSVTSATVRKLLGVPGIRLMSFERANAYLRRNNFLSKVVLPKGTVDLTLDLPAQDTVLLAPAATVVASPRLHPALIDLLLLTMRDAHRRGGHLEALGEFPSAEYVTYPLAPAAEHFYERGPPFLQRYLPFWAANLVDRLKIMLLPLITVLYPLMKLLPPAYSWRMRSKVNRWYKALQVVDDGLRAESISREDAIRRLEEIERSVEQVSVPVGFAASAYTLRLHIDFLRHKAEALPSRDEAG
ncbi:MAG: TAXI family TRAP transporter solute-binding subunit [Alphaproteobacteria bacterium]|jgi:TRAP transporter TAXI family solute receptor|nr:TAXI family TRAP transporter solute-binding subunit [Alphaproteobacteria bacterium]